MDNNNAASESTEPQAEARGRKGGMSVMRRTNAESEAIQAANLARRLRQPIIVRGVEMAKTISVIQPSQFGKLGVDERYQRVRIGDEVNQLIHVIRGGGEIPDPIDVAERPDGSWWIIDGQQRYWAHEETGTPLRALIHKVPDYHAESNLFVVLNSRRKVAPRVIMRGWPGLSGDFMRRMNEDPRSPLYGKIDFSHNTHLPITAPTLMKGVLIVTTGLERPSGDTATVLLPRTDAALRVAGRVAWAEAFTQLVALVFNMEAGSRVRVLPVQALARVAHQKYSEAGRPVFPKTCALLRRVNWDTVVPTHAWQYMPILMLEIEKRWRK